MKSIRLFLITVLLSGITIINFLAALHGYRTSMEAANELFDHKLEQIAKVLADSTTTSLETFPFKNSSLESLPIQSTSDPTFWYQVWHEHHLIHKSANAPDNLIVPGDNGFYDVNVNNYRWRALSKTNPNNYQVVVAERMDVRFVLAESVIVESILPIVACLPLIGLIVWLTISKGLRPLKELSATLSQKRSDDLGPIELSTNTRELAQLQNSVNSLLHRLSSAFAREQRFAANAAHELRTPLSVLKVHAYNLRQEQPTNANIDLLEHDLDRLSHMIEQLLALHRTSVENYEENMVTITLYTLVQKVISSYYAHIDNKHQTIELLGDEYGLSTLLSNLLSNANKYTPVSGTIRIRITSDKNRILLIIEDSGSGIPEQERDKVFERFYRIGGDRHASGEQGCGLGLSIVKHVADLHHAEIRLSESIDLGGLQIEVSFPAISAKLK